MMEDQDLNPEDLAHMHIVGVAFQDALTKATKEVGRENVKHVIATPFDGLPHGALCQATLADRRLRPFARVTVWERPDKSCEIESEFTSSDDERERMAAIAIANLKALDDDDARALLRETGNL